MQYQESDKERNSLSHRLNGFVITLTDRLTEHMGESCRFVHFFCTEMESPDFFGLDFNILRDYWYKKQPIGYHFSKTYMLCLLFHPPLFHKVVDLLFLYLVAQIPLCIPLF